jgi:glyoxalase family protein
MMSTQVTGIHHITLCPGNAQQDLDFFTQVLGQRLVKQTVLMDGRIPIYHLYYGNADADIGSIATSFPYSRKIGKPGSGQLSATTYAVPKGSLAFWDDHLNRHGAEHSARLERFGQRYIRVRHPAGLLFDLLEDDADRRRPWTTDYVTEDVATRGFFGAVLSVRDIDEMERFLVEALGLRRAGVDGPYYRFAIPGASVAATLDIHHEPDRTPGSWGFGAGTAHHIAFNVDTDEALVRQKALYEELGYTDASELKDRYYFHSMYVRSPGGILVECTSNVPGGFYQDESPDELGTKLHLPPWYEEKHAEIVAMLEPLVVPRQNRPRLLKVQVPQAAGMRRATSGIALSRTKAEFITERD